MIALLDTIGPTIWRASWQAAALALLVVLLLRCSGERLSPRWQFLLWGVVLASTRRLKARVERLLRSPSVTTLRAPTAAGLLFGMALIGLTDAMPGARAQARKDAAPTGKEQPKANTHTVSGHCVNHADGSALAGVSVRLYQVEGRMSPPVEIARTITGADGRYTFTGLAPPRPGGHLDRLDYGVLGFLGDRPIGIPFIEFREEEEVVTIGMALETSTLSGKVIDADGRPVAGATLMRYWIDGRPIPGLLSTTTDVAGRFKFDKVPVYKTPDGRAWDTVFTVRHPDYPEAGGTARALPADVVVKLPASSLMIFMQAHDLDQGTGGEYFALGRPVREIVGALRALTGQSFDDTDLFSMTLSEDPRRRVLQDRIFRRQAQRWAEWWEANWRRFTQDAAYQKVKLNVADEPLPPAALALGPTARLSGGMTGVVLSPAIPEGQYVWDSLDVDTGYPPKLPARIPRDEPARDLKQLADWASQSGADLICVNHRLPDGTETCVMRALGMQVREIDSRDLRNLDRLIAARTLPEGRPVVGELLMHYDSKSQQLVPDANAAFLFITREGNWGVIEITDRFARDASPPPGGGGRPGVRFNLKEIIP